MYRQDLRQPFVPTCPLCTNPFFPPLTAYHRQPRTTYAPRGCSIREGSSVIYTHGSSRANAWVLSMKPYFLLFNKTALPAMVTSVSENM